MVFSVFSTTTHRLFTSLFVLAAVLLGLVALAAPAKAESIDFSPVTTVTSGGCIARQNLQAHARGETPGTVTISAPRTETVFGLPAISGNCAFRLTLRWHNLNTGATGVKTTRIVVPDSCDISYCFATWVQTGPGRVVVDATTDHPHIAGRAEIIVP